MPAASVGVVTPLYRQPIRMTGSMSAGKASSVIFGMWRSATGSSTGKPRRLAR